MMQRLALGLALVVFVSVFVIVIGIAAMLSALQFRLKPYSSEEPQR